MVCETQGIVLLITLCSIVILLIWLMCHRAYETKCCVLLITHSSIAIWLIGLSVSWLSKPSAKHISKIAMLRCVLGFLSHRPDKPHQQNSNAAKHDEQSQKIRNVTKQLIPEYKPPVYPK